VTSVPRIPAAPPLAETAVEELVDFLRRRRVLVLTGAGCSTESGIPDYRGPGGSLRHREPIRYQEFMRSPEARARYWSRSMTGWPTFSAARPNRGHAALARLEEAGSVSAVVTQNVDGLHQRAGSRRVVDLHGRLSRVRCTGCGAPYPRDALQERLAALNPSVRSRPARTLADGDAELPEGAEEGFRVPDCRRCGGILKPDVVFFGETVPRARVERCWALYEEADALLVVGSSLAVFSGRRFVLRAARDGRPVAIANVGPTRGDETAQLKVEAHLGTLLPRVARALHPA
jgi:NAD-dependent SIR2 family protein deacetylase